MKKEKINYFVFDRLFYLLQEAEVSRLYYMNKWEVSRSTFFRDLEHLRDFYNIVFVYDAYKKKYIKENY